MMFQRTPCPYVLLLVGLMLAGSSLMAQSYRGKRAGRANASGFVRDCNMAGTVFMEVNRSFGEVNGGRCVLNGSRFELSEPSGLERVAKSFRKCWQFARTFASWCETEQS